MSEAETLTAQQMRERIEEAPYPLEGAPIFEREERDEPMGNYGMAAESLARAMLVVAEEDPTLLDVPSKEEDPSGIDRAHNDKLWEAVKARFPGVSDWLGGPTGFQYGWAHNAVRYALGREGGGNPAIMSIGVREEE